MCRSIKTLRGTPATEEDVRAAALQFVRKLSGYRQPSQRNAEAFGRAVDAVADASSRMLADLDAGHAKREMRPRTPPRAQTRGGRG